MILSRDNKHIKLAMKLKNRKYREAENKYLIEGIRFVEEAIKEDLVEYLLYSDRIFTSSDYSRIMDSNCTCYEIEDEVLKELSGTETPQGVVAIVRKAINSLKDIDKGIVIIADGINDPGNLGTIIRTADAAAAKGIILTKGTVDLYNDKTLRATMGSIFHVPVIIEEDFTKLITKLQNENYTTFATSLEGSESIYECSFPEKSAIIIGNEANGIPREHMELVGRKIKIPMPGRAESLNAGVAAGIIIYEVLRQIGKY